MEIIAEIGQNHNGDMALARQLIRSAKENGADVAKFQLYDARALFPKEGNEWFDYNCKTELSHDQIRELADECRRAGIEFMASVFDVERIAWLEEVGVKRHKIASRSIHDVALIESLVANPDVALVFPDYYLVDDFGEIFAHERRQRLYKDNHMLDMPPNGACTLIRKNVLEELGGYAGRSSYIPGHERRGELVRSGSAQHQTVPSHAAWSGSVESGKSHIFRL